MTSTYAQMRIAFALMCDSPACGSDDVIQITYSLTLTFWIMYADDLADKIRFQISGASSNIFCDAQTPIGGGGLRTELIHFLIELSFF